ncbi:ChrR family anti-sigma-E factor [Maricaulis sp.]|uniref:ChrR family anti-sigma-E factor n=1 Tax=Maricaulis sp. TaxID=1486257 RepID=UPI001B1AB3C4|nr:ChrR family anti-sigma-E factor [Maricaulis sp.]MBO6795552.1 cupin domain-containing protein [Maricaulis sp.]
MTRRGEMLDDAWYMDYAAGTLKSEGEDVLMAAHVELSDEARGRVEELEKIGAALLMMAPENEPLPFTADDLLAAEGALAPLEVGDVTRHEAYVPQALGDFLQRIHKTIRWEFLGPGLNKAMLWTGPDGEKLWLLKAQPGVAIPQHGHNGSELTLVLKGSFWDGEQQFCPGDVEYADEAAAHDIRIDDGGECICLALTRGKLRYDNPILKLFQVFTGL